MNENNPYAPSTANLELPLDGAPLELADRVTRLVAVIIDGGIGGLTGIPLAAGVFMILAHFNKSSIILAGLGGICVLIGLACVIALIIYNVNLMAQHGQTIGKKLMNIKVLRANGNPLALGRWITHRILAITLLGFIPLVGGLVSLADILMIFRENHQCLHDEIADTIVVKA